jgi:hypothetical protein
MSKYQIRFTLHLDRPELRGDSYPNVPAGKQYQTWGHKTFNGAVGEFNAILKGCYDYASEYVSKVEVVRLHEGKSPTVVRKPVERKRVNESDHLAMIRTLAVGSKRNNPYALWMPTYKVF